MINTNGSGWRVAIFLAGGLLATVVAGGKACVQRSVAEERVTAVEERVMTTVKTLKEDVYGELKEHGALLREIDRRLARIEGNLASERR